MPAIIAPPAGTACCPMVQHTLAKGARNTEQVGPCNGLVWYVYWCLLPCHVRSPAY